MQCAVHGDPIGLRESRSEFCWVKMVTPVVKNFDIADFTFKVYGDTN